MSEEEFSDEEVFDEMSNNGILEDSMDESGVFKRVICVFYQKIVFFKDIYVFK